MIRRLQEDDVSQVMGIWLQGNEEAHPFVGKDYWKSNFDAVQKQLFQADVFVCESEGEVRGFIGIADGYIAGIFVDGECRSQGIGKQLIRYAKEKYPALSLSVYQKNTRAAAFYLREGFSIDSERMDEATGEMEYTMVWKVG